MSPRPLRAMLRAFSWLVPAATRGDWRREWEAEVAHRHAALERAGRLDTVACLDLLLRVLGAAADAVEMRSLAAGSRAESGRWQASAAETARAGLAAAGVALAVAVVAAGAAAVVRIGSPVSVPLMAVGTAVAVALLGAAARMVRVLVAERAPDLHRPVRRLALVPPSGGASVLRRRLLSVAAGAGGGLALTLLAAAGPLARSGAHAVLQGRLGIAGAACFAASACAVGLLAARGASTRPG